MAADDRVVYEDEAPVRKPSSGSSCLPWVFGFGVFSVICGVLCCGGLAYFGFNLMATELEVAIRDNAQVREHIGDLQSVSLNFMKSIADDDDDTWVYNLKGSKAQAEMIVNQTTGDSGDEVFHSAKLRLADGTMIDIQIQPEVDLLQNLKLELDHDMEKAEQEAEVKKAEGAEPAPAAVDTPAATPAEPAKPE